MVEQNFMVTEISEKEFQRLSDHNNYVGRVISHETKNQVTYFSIRKDGKDLTGQQILDYLFKQAPEKHGVYDLIRHWELRNIEVVVYAPKDKK